MGTLNHDPAVRGEHVRIGRKERRGLIDMLKDVPDERKRDVILKAARSLRGSAAFKHRNAPRLRVPRTDVIRLDPDDAVVTVGRQKFEELPVTTADIGNCRMLVQTAQATRASASACASTSGTA